jgi:hypothetical protein
MSDKTFKIELAKRPWYEWLGWAIWLFITLFTFQNAIASGAEYEPAAATIFWVVFAVLLIAGGIVWYARGKALTA